MLLCTVPSAFNFSLVSISFYYFFNCICFTRYRCLILLFNLSFRLQLHLLVGPLGTFCSCNDPQTASHRAMHTECMAVTQYIHRNNINLHNEDTKHHRRFHRYYKQNHIWIHLKTTTPKLMRSEFSFPYIGNVTRAMFNYKDFNRRLCVRLNVYITQTFNRAVNYDPYFCFSLIIPCYPYIC